MKHPTLTHDQQFGFVLQLTNHLAIIEDLPKNVSGEFIFHVANKILGITKEVQVELALRGMHNAFFKSDPVQTFEPRIDDLDVAEAFIIIALQHMKAKAPVFLRSVWPHLFNCKLDIQVAVAQPSTLNPSLN